MLAIKRTKGFIPYHFSKKSGKGFTLIETLIYIALFGVILTGVITAAYPLITGAEKLSQRVVAESESTFVLHKIGWALSSAPISNIDDVSMPEKLRIIQVGGGVLSIQQGINTPNSIEISDGPAVFTPLTASRVIFSNFTVVHTAPAVPGAPHTIRIDFIAGGQSYSQTYNVFY